MARVPITIMGYRCDRCGHEWLPRRKVETDPRICPKCKTAYWNQPRRAAMSYEDFRTKIENTLRGADAPLTWTELRTSARLPQMFPNNQWVRRLEQDIGLRRERDKHGIIHWQVSVPPAKQVKRG